MKMIIGELIPMFLIFNALGGSYPPIESTDAAVLVTLPPGSYIADVFGAAGNVGKAISCRQ